MRGQAHRLTYHPPLRPRGPRSHRFDGSQVHLDLNEPVSGPSHLFMALSGTPPTAAHVPGGSWDVPFMEPTRLPTRPVSPAPAEQPDEPAARGRARRAPRRRGSGPDGHM
ncbi:hypothetical protein PIB30_031219 [Stylosanthes scabra]|uniref:Uncharacterized protein n=1 Tax=Stylosanthes scabra TaxID=79078 RepID=A0ABU6TCW5_9FABA|nr:hypothetical protein [Stylosanthes scabra]